jgi:CheY-like chemotaxis protein
MMGGGIKVESKPGRGSVFSFELVFDKAGAQDRDFACEGLESSIGSGESSGKEIPDFSGKKILVVDDVMTNRAVVRVALKGTGADILEAKDGLQALEMVTAMIKEIDLILMDISMPNMDGYQATKAIRALDTDKAKTIPIIALTAHTYREDIEAALQAGMDFHLGKPLNFEIFLTTLIRYLLETQPEY